MRKSHISDMEFTEREDVVELSIHSRVPNKWRFVDLETGEVWKHDPNATEPRLVRATDLTIGLTHDS